MFQCYENSFPFGSSYFVDSKLLMSPFTPQSRLRSTAKVQKSKFHSPNFFNKNSLCYEYSSKTNGFEQCCDNSCFIDLTKKRKSNLNFKNMKSGKAFLSPRNKDHRPHTYYFSDPDSPLGISIHKKFREFSHYVITSIPPYAEEAESINEKGNKAKKSWRIKCISRIEKARQVFLSKKNKEEENTVNTTTAENTESNEPNNDDLKNETITVQQENQLIIKSVSESVYEMFSFNKDLPPNAHSFDFVIYKLCFLLKYWKNSYRILRHFIPFPALQSIKNNTDEDLNLTMLRLTNPKYTCMHFASLLKERDQNKEMKIVLSVDAIDVDLFKKNDKEYKSIFIFYALPIAKNTKSFPAFVMLHPTGKATEEVQKKIDKVIKNANKLPGINISIRVVDGDTSYNHIHTKQFEVIKNLYDAGGFMNVIHCIQLGIETHEDQLIMTDMIHYAKNRRTQAIINGFCVNGNPIDISPLIEILDESAAVLDKSSLSKLQDSFPVEIFNFKVISELIKRNEWDIVLFIFPMSCWLEACLNQKLDKPSRLFLMHVSFSIYMQIYQIQLDSRNKNEFHPQISIIRALNSLAVLYAEFEKCEDYFPFARYSTMTQEHFHGLLRSMNFNNDHADVILKNSARAALAQQYQEDLGLNYIARTRLSVGGVNWIKDKFKLSALPFGEDIKINADDVKDFIFDMSSYGADQKPTELIPIISDWVDKASNGTFLLKKGKFAKRGRHILNRQIANSKDIDQRYHYDEDWQEHVPNEEEKYNLQLEDSDFNEIINEE